MSTERAIPGPKEAVTVNSAASSPSRTIPVNGATAAPVAPTAPEEPEGPGSSDPSAGTGTGATDRVTWEGARSLSKMVSEVGTTANCLSGCAGKGRL